MLMTTTMVMVFNYCYYTIISNINTIITKEGCVPHCCGCRGTTGIASASPHRMHVKAMCAHIGHIHTEFRVAALRTVV